MAIVIIDYGMGNLRSVSKALEHFGADVKVSSDPNEIANADKLVLPGVGSFGDAMEELRQRGLVDIIQAYIEDQKPFLGICLGLQLLFSESEESPGVQGLGIFPGKIQKFKTAGIKIPQMGWNQTEIVSDHPLLEGIENGSYFYFVHSYYAQPRDFGMVAAICEYGEDKVVAMVGDANVFATQFHPEKSQEAGLRILNNFVKWTY